MENNLFNKVRNLWIPSHAIWTIQCTGSVPTMDQRGSCGTHRHVLHRLCGWRADIFEHPTRTRKRPQQYPQCNTKMGMKVKPSKWEFHQSETDYQGFIIGQEGVKTDPVKTQAIWDWTTPKKIKEIQCFLGLCNFYRRFIEAFSRTARPLYARTKKECVGNWEWGDKEQKTFDELGTKHTTAPVLVYFDPLAPTKIETDGSK